MQRNRERQVPKATSTSVTRRHVLEGLGLFAAVTACSDAEPPGGSGGAGTGPTGIAGGGAGGTPAGAGGAGGGVAGSGGGGGLVAPPFTDVPMCTASRTDGAGQGPFFIHDGEMSDDVSLFRQDIRGRYEMDAEPGIEMQLHLRILDSTSTDCNGTPAPDVDVYIWHTDAQGYYSGFGNPGDQQPDMPYAGVPGRNDLDNTDRFCRGVQTTDANGVVSFRTIYPGWYNGRDIHIHFLALKKGSTALGRVAYSKANTSNQWLFTTQFYFDPEFSASVHETYEPYKRRTSIAAYAGTILADENNNSNLRATARLVGEVVIAQLQILLNPA
jgi:protocatechuate 3,4-dioxygenase beta subunit